LICLILFSIIGLEAMKIDPWLSLQIGTGPTLSPSSQRTLHNQAACQPVSDSAMYSASVEDKAIVF
jgi:hypothetical protein